MMIVRRRSVLFRLTFALLVTFALASHFNGAVDAYTLAGNYRIHYPNTVNDDELQSYENYGAQQMPQQEMPDLGRFSEYDYEQQQQLQQQQPPYLRPEAEPLRFASNIVLNGPNSFNKYKDNQVNDYFRNQEQDKQARRQLQELLESLYEAETSKQNVETKKQDQQLSSSSQNILKIMPQPMKKESIKIDPLENELFGIEKKPLEDAETMDKDSDDNSHDFGTQGLNRESVSNQNYAETDIFKRKLSSVPVHSSLIKSDTNQASYDNYRSLPNSFVQTSDSSSSQTFLASMSDIYFVAMVVCVSSVAICSVIGAGYCFYKVQQNNRQAADVEFPSYGVIGPNVNGDCGLNSLNGSSPNSKCSSPPADRKLTQAAQMYHYQHQKQQMISNERNVVRVSNHGTANSDLDSDEENEDGEYTVYECPGLAPTGEMEVKNPLFQDDLTPMSSPSILNGKPQTKK